MKREYTLSGLGCADCAIKIEEAVGRLPGVDEARVNVLTSTLTFRTKPEFELEGEIARIVHTFEPDVRLSAKAAGLAPAAPIFDPIRLLPVGMGLSLFLLALLAPMSHQAGLTLHFAAYLLIGGEILWEAGRRVLSGRLTDENILMSLATLGALSIGESSEAVAVMLFARVGMLFEQAALVRSRRFIASLAGLRPDFARLIQKDGQTQTVPPETVSPGETILVRPGERIPLDGKVLSGSGFVDTSAVTGESRPRGVRLGDAVLSGCVNLDGVLTVKTTQPFHDSTVSKILDMAQNAADRKAPAESFITVFSRYYTPLVVLAAALTAVIPPLFMGGVWNDWLYRGLIFLVVSCPCALVISIPLSYFGGLGAASKRGVLVKGGAYLEALAHVDTVVFDKTGTLTAGVFRVTEVLPADGVSRNALLRDAALAERISDHPIARSILTAAGDIPDRPDDGRERPGLGVLAFHKGRRIAAGNEALMREESAAVTPVDRPGTKVYVAVDGHYRGCIVISDEILPGSAPALRALRKLGVKRTVMLTGDAPEVARDVARALNIDEVHASLLPHQKVEVLETLLTRKKTRGKIAFMGDGLNDAPVLKRADIGIAMGGHGRDAAIEAADVVLMSGGPEGLVDGLRVAHRTKRVVWQNIVLSLGVKFLVLALGALGRADMWAAVFADVGTLVICTLNAVRLLRPVRREATPAGCPS